MSDDIKLNSETKDLTQQDEMSNLGQMVVSVRCMCTRLYFDQTFAMGLPSFQQFIEEYTVLLLQQKHNINPSDVRIDFTFKDLKKSVGTATLKEHSDIIDFARSNGIDAAELWGLIQKRINEKKLRG